MVQKKTQASIVGMAIGTVLVVALGIVAGLQLIPALAISLIGLAFGGWIAERWYEKRTVTTESKRRETA